MVASLVTRIVLAESGSPYETIITDESGRQITMATFPLPPPKTKVAMATVPDVHIAGATDTLSNVPAFDWSYGCSATSAAMLFGYYDRSGYSNMYTGPTGGGVCPLNNSGWGHTTYPSVTCGECPLSATHNGTDGRAIKGHVDDYWIDYGDAGPDPYLGNWAEHTLGDCTGDYMGTNQAKYSNNDGSTTFYWYTGGDPLYDFTGYEPTSRDGCHGMKLFAESRGYTVVTNFSQAIKGPGTGLKGFTFANFQSEIDAGRPVLIQVTGHTMLGYGYDTTGSIIYVHDTWDYSDHQMTWGGTYSGLQHRAVTVIRLQALSTAIEIRAQDYLTAVSTITFPQADPGTTVSNPSNNVDGGGSPQAFGGAGDAKPVVTLVNTDTVAYTIWYNITTFSEGVVSEEYYLINDKGAACANADAISNAVTFGADTTTGTAIAATGDAGEDDQKDLYLKVVLSALAGKSGTSTIAILGEIP